MGPDKKTEEENLDNNIEHIDLAKEYSQEDNVDTGEKRKNNEEAPNTQQETNPSDDTFISKPQLPKSKFKKFINWYKTKKKISIPLTALLITLIILAIPVTRYKILGLFIKKDFSVTVLDAQTNKPVSEVAVNLAGEIGSTDKDGKATLRVPLGKSDLNLTKKYYENQSSSVNVGLSESSNNFEAKLNATGRQVPLSVIDKISKKPVADAVISAADTTIRTDNDGKATIVLPQGQEAVDGTVSKDNFNSAAVKISITEEVSDKNTFSITPAGKLYFLSKLSGKIDVVKTNFDGTDRKTVLAGTGKEDGSNTILLASRDWKYLALLSKRDGQEKIFLIETASDALSVIDEGDATFTLTGWLDDNFVYKVNRTNIKEWQNNRTSLKSFNATNKKITTLDNSVAKGSEDDYLEQSTDTPYLTSDRVVYTKSWSQYYGLDVKITKDMKNTIVSIKPDGTDKKTLKSFDPEFGSEYGSYFQTAAYKPNEIYIGFTNSDNKTTYFEYEDYQIKSLSNIDEENFYGFYPTYLLSPSGKQTSWYEQRDGKNTLFIGDQNGNNEKELAKLTDYVPYGWYTDDYLLYSKNNSELYIVSATDFNIENMLKVSDYHKPDYDFAGYGGGYGGF